MLHQLHRCTIGAFGGEGDVAQRPLDAAEHLAAVAGGHLLAVVLVGEHELGRTQARVLALAPGVQLGQAVHAVLLRDGRPATEHMLAAVAAAGQRHRVLLAEARHGLRVLPCLPVQPLHAGLVGRGCGRKTPVATQLRARAGAGFGDLRVEGEVAVHHEQAPLAQLMATGFDIRHWGTFRVARVPARREFAPSDCRTWLMPAPCALLVCR
jgi:hypothetical protein